MTSKVKLCPRVNFEGRISDLSSYDYRRLGVKMSKVISMGRHIHRRKNLNDQIYQSKQKNYPHPTPSSQTPSLQSHKGGLHSNLGPGELPSSMACYSLVVYSDLFYGFALSRMPCCVCNLCEPPVQLLSEDREPGNTRLHHD